MPVSQVAIRLGTEGKATVKSDFAEVAKDGTAALGQIAAAADATASSSEKAAQRQIDAWKRQAAQAKVAAVQGQSQSAFNSFAGIDQGVSKSAKDSASAFEELLDPIDKVNSALGLNRTQTMIAQSAVMRFADTLIAGQSPLRAFALEAHKIPEVLSFDEGGMAGGLAKVTGLLTPLNVGLAAATVIVLAGAAAFFSYSSAVDKLDAISQGSGRLIGATGDALEANAEA
ncbi:MAG: hypothetical protein ACRYG4_20710, partial [Janthinobacterium lividum]